MNEALQKLAHSLKVSGRSLTAARKAVFLALLDKEPQTMAKLIKATPQIDRASVYRAVSLFEQLGIVQRLQLGWKYQLELTDRFSAHHHHLTCTNCGSSNDFKETSVMQSEIARIGQATGFTVTGHQLELQGLCKNCQQKRSRT